ncbi:peptide-methionine (S)-S-oxide reductase MsrA [Myroides fluvii]|uniref:peptide-methionine (S)-S-oxide reductase MsrA n=1 Tax=Myroides fluvii TaxID=2572594 RepID=UPI00131A72E6|nr:peptide-methionine (S)-S-oxide reductase MsrA [Myroides fluvii]
MKKAIVAGGCFWCTEAVFKHLKGVIEAVPGYIGGKQANPTYEEVCTGETGHAEAIEIVYDEREIRYTQLLEIFFATHNPTTLNRQGEDRGTQYRSEIFYFDEEQKQTALEYIGILTDEKVFDQPIVTQLSPATTFYVAEDYHKNYFERKGTENPYCQMVVKPKVDKFKMQYASKLK